MVAVVACIEGIRLQSPVNLSNLCYSVILYVRVDKTEKTMSSAFCQTAYWLVCLTHNVSLTKGHFSPLFLDRRKEIIGNSDKKAVAEINNINVLIFLSLRRQICSILTHVYFKSTVLGTC